MHCSVSAVKELVSLRLAYKFFFNLLGLLPSLILYVAMKHWNGQYGKG